MIDSIIISAWFLNYFSFLFYLNEVAETGEDDPTHADQEDQEKKLLEAVLKSVSDRLEKKQSSCRMTI